MKKLGLTGLIVALWATALVACWALRDTMRVAFWGVPSLSLQGALASDPTALTLTGVRVRTSLVGHDTYRHPSRKDQQRFVVMVVADAAPEEPTPLFLGCRSTGTDVAAERARCLERFGRKPLTLCRAETMLYTQALDNLRAQAPIGQTEPQLYEVTDNPRGDALAEVAPIPVLVLLGAALLWVRLRGR